MTSTETTMGPTGVDRLRARAREIAPKITPKLNEHQKKALNAGTDALLGTLANFALAAAAGLTVGRLHPNAPQILYAAMATAVGVAIADDKPAIGNMLAAGGMVAGSSLVMWGIAGMLVPQGAGAPADPFTFGRRVGDTIYGTPGVSIAPPFTTQTPTPSEVAVGPSQSPSATGLV